jgi:DNA (cytosine-5)-methyltransferase 1
LLQIYWGGFMYESISVVDIFCGVGGLSHGLLNAGLPVRAGVDNDLHCCYAFEANNPGTAFVERNVDDPRLPELLEVIYGPTDMRVLVGCAPCQPFSSQTQKNMSSREDKRGDLLYRFADIVRALRPTLVSMENVARIIRQPVFRDFVANLTQMGYHVWAKAVDCRKYGVPQIRRRLVLMASQLGPLELDSSVYDRYKTVRDTIGHLEAIPAGGVSKSDPLHRTQRLSTLNMRRIRNSKPGGTWLDWDEELRLTCHKKKTGQTYTSVYTRMAWDIPSPTITTQFYSFGTGRFGHPEQNRALSLREGALLQTFPQDYSFVRPNTKAMDISMSRLGGQIGNAVPVELAKAIGRSMVEHLMEHGVLRS